jgi:PAT family beta-lactamase induction signal transducer AmpG
MSQYGWRIGSVVAAALALVIAGRWGWQVGYIVCAALALPAMLVGLVLGEPLRRSVVQQSQNLRAVWRSIRDPLAEFLNRRGALLVLLFVLLHKVGDTIANLTFRLLFDQLHYSNDEIAVYDVGFGFWAYLAGIFIGGWLYTRLGLKRAVFFSLVLMAVSNLSFAGLAAAGHSNWALAGAIGFENLASGIGGVTVVAYLSALCDLRYTAAQFALLSAASSVVGRFLSGTTAGWLIERLGFVDFYVLSTVVALPGVLIFWLLMRKGLVDVPDDSRGTL